MENEDTKQPSAEPTSNPDQEENTSSLATLASEIETLKENVQKRKSETTTLRILFYTGLAVLLFGFIYTNQTLQRAQYKSIDSSVGRLQIQVSHTLLLLERKLQSEILDLSTKMEGRTVPGINHTLQRMSQTLEHLEPQTTSMGILIERLQRNSNELIKMVGDLKTEKTMPPMP